MSNSTKILIVDDSMLARSIIVTHFTGEENDFELVEAASGTDALKKHEGQDFDHYILDYNMPGMDGLELAEKIRKLNRNAHIALCTANIQNPIKSKAEDLGLFFLNKPVTAEELRIFLNAA